MVIMSGEMVVDYSLRLKRELRKNRAVWVFDYFNDVGGYILSLCVLLEGGRENGGNMHYGSTPLLGSWAETIELCLMDRIFFLDRQLYSGP